MKEKQSTANVFNSPAGFSISLAVLMIVVGFLAIAIPTFAGLSISLIVGWMTVFGGVIYLAYAFAASVAKTADDRLWLLRGNGFSLVDPQIQVDERHAERTRIAQQLHDSLLQGVVSASIRLNLAVDNLPEDSPSKPQFDGVIELMRKVTAEGRNTICGLRSSGEVGSDSIEKALANLHLIPLDGKKVDFRVLVEGTTRPLSPMARKEAYYIGREALFNAYRHSHADNIEAIVEYSPRHLRISVQDDGRGIDTNVLREGRVGHWGLKGMRERAEKMGAILKVWSRIGAGTEVELLVPHHIAF